MQTVFENALTKIEFLRVICNEVLIKSRDRSGRNDTKISIDLHTHVYGRASDKSAQMSGFFNVEINMMQLLDIKDNYN